MRILFPLFMMFVFVVPALAEPSDKRIALTFDDGPRGDGAFLTGTERTARLIAALDRAEVEGAMFFITTGNMERHDPEGTRVRAYAAAGHPLANHSHTHPWLYRTPADDYLADIDRAGAILSGFEGVLPYFRFPFLDEGRTETKRDALRDGLAVRGLKNGYVTVDTYDWHMDNLARDAVHGGHPVDMDALRDAYVEILLQPVVFYDALARRVLGRSPAHVLLLHENDLAALFIGDLVAALRQDGWRIVPAVEAYRDPIADRLPETLFNGQGRVAALAAEAAMPRRTLVSPTEDEAWLEARFLERGLIPESDTTGE